jgi:hypothetical protein
VNAVHIGNSTARSATADPLTRPCQPLRFEPGGVNLLPTVIEEVEEVRYNRGGGRPTEGGQQSRYARGR